MQDDLNFLKQNENYKRAEMEHREFPEAVAEANGEEEVYSTLYKSAESEKEMEDLMSKVSSKIIDDPAITGEIGKITAIKVTQESRCFW